MGCRSRAHSSPSLWPCISNTGLSRSLTMISKISLSCVPARIRSAFQQTLRMDRPETRVRRCVSRGTSKPSSKSSSVFFLRQTFVPVLHLPQVDLGDGFEVHVPKSDAAVSSSCGESFFTCVHAEDPSLEQTTQELTPLHRDRHMDGSLRRTLKEHPGWVSRVLQDSPRVPPVPS